MRLQFVTKPNDPPCLPPSGSTTLLDAMAYHPHWILTIPGHAAAALHAHLFPGDDDEHGAVLLAGVAMTSRGPRLLVREVILAADGVDYVPGGRGYRMLTAAFVTKCAIRARNERLVYLAVHNHMGDHSVAFSDDDLSSHSRGYPALLDVLDGLPVGALVFARSAIAGTLWLSPQKQLPMRLATILDGNLRQLGPAPEPAAPERTAAYDRQARVFGDRGQHMLGNARVGIIGVGGIGMQIVEYLSRLGVGHFVVVDPDVIEETNIPRITGASRRHAVVWLTRQSRARWLRRLGRRLARRKVDHARHLIRLANPSATVERIAGDVTDSTVARRLLECDYLFLAADSMQARLVFNAIVHAYLIPGVQVGSKIQVDEETGEVGDIFTATRFVSPSSGCLWCNGLITPTGLQRESESAAERLAQRYVADTGVTAPSVITLNATPAADATNAFLFAIAGLFESSSQQGYIQSHPRLRKVARVRPRKDATCSHCGLASGSILALGDKADLPTKVR